jgi:hypothetical protein
VDNHYRKDMIAAAMKKWSVLHTARIIKEGIRKPISNQCMGRK